MNAVALDPGFPGAGRVVRELAAISGGKVKFEGWWKEGHWFLAKVYPDAEFLFLPAWHPQYKDLVHEKKVIVWTSPIIQSEFAPVEFEYMRQILQLLDAGKLYAVWFGSNDWLPYVSKEGRRVFYCPYPVTFPPYCKMVPSRNPPKEVSLFGPLGPRKNAAIQAMAAQKAGCKVHITDGSAQTLLRGLGVDYVNHGWVTPARYHDLVCSIYLDVGLQCSIPGSESFSYVTWDHISRDVPCISTVDWIESIDKSLFMRWPYDVLVIANRIKIVGDRPHVFERGLLREKAERFAELRNAEVKRVLQVNLGLDL